MKCARVGILTCSNTTKVLDCSVGACLRDMYERKGAFEKYQDQEIELAGLIACNGCPTVAGPATIVPRVESLIQSGAKHVHLSYCMLALCPFVKKYIRAVQDAFPETEVVLGTHEPHQSEQQFRCAVGAMLEDRRKTIIP